MNEKILSFGNVAEQQKKIVQLTADDLAHCADVSAKADAMQKSLEEKDADNRSQAQRIADKEQRVDRFETEISIRDARLVQLLNRSFRERLMSKDIKRDKDDTRE